MPQVNRSGEVKIILTEAGRSADLSGAHVIDASPSAGAAPTIAVNYLVESLKPVKIAEVRSLHFPHVSLVSEGVAAQPKIELYMHEDSKVKLLLIMRNFMIDSNEGGYLIADKLHQFLIEKGALNYYLLAGLRITGERGVYVASADPNDAKVFIESGARVIKNLENLPADRLSSYLLFFYIKRTKKAWLLVTEVVPYFPDPVAARDLLQVLSKALGFTVNLEKLEQEIEKQKAILEEFQKDYEKMLHEKRKRGKEPFYIG